MAEEVGKLTTSVSPGRIPSDLLTPAPTRISSTPTLALSSKSSSSSFPAFRLKKSYWRKEKLRSVERRETVTQIFSHRLPFYGKARPAPTPLAELVTFSHEKRWYNSLSRMRRSAAEVSEYPFWRRLGFLHETGREDKHSPSTNRNLCLSVESLRGKYGDNKLDKVRAKLASRAHRRSPQQQRESLRKKSIPLLRQTKSRGKLLPIGVMLEEQPRFPGNTYIILPEVRHMPAA